MLRTPAAAASERSCVQLHGDLGQQLLVAERQPYGSLGLDVAGGSGNEAEVGPRWGRAPID
jgi:hypothetical protein